MKEITEAIIQMVKIGNMLNWNDPIDQDYVNAINGLKTLQNTPQFCDRCGWPEKRCTCNPPPIPAT